MKEKTLKKFLVVIIIIALVAIGATYKCMSSKKENNNNNGEQKVSQVEENKTSNEEKDTDKDNANSDSYFVLYEGREIENKVGIQNISDMKIDSDTKQKYNTKYYNYENGKYIGEKTGTFGEETTEGNSCVENVSKIAISKNIKAVPRNYTNIEELPKELEDMADYSSVDINKIDLDGDGKEEYIVCYTIDYKKGDIGDGEPQASSGIMLFDNNYKKIADLANLQNGFWSNIKEESNKVFLSLKDVEYADIDNDGVMEILIKIPAYEGSKLSILKYNRGDIDGNVNLEVNVNT